MKKLFFKILLIIYLLLGFHSLAQAQDYQISNRLFKNYIQQAIKYESQGKVKEANEFYLKADEIFPHRFESLFGLAKTYGWLHKNDLAFKYYEQLLEKSPDNISLLEAYAGFLKDTGDFDSAAKMYDKLINLTKNDSYKISIADILFLQGKYDAALDLYREIYTQYPENLQVEKSLAFLYFVQGNFEESSKFYKSYLNKVQDAESQLNYAKSLFYSGNPLSAQSLLEEYLVQYPSNADALMSLGEIYLSLNYSQKAVNVLSRAVILDPQNIKIKIDLAKAYMSAKNFEQSKSILLDVARVQPNNPEILELLGDLSFYAGDFDAALSYYKNITGFSENSRIVYKIAQASQYSKKLDIAELLFQKLLTVPEYKESAQIGLAEIELSKGNALKSRKMLNSILSENQDNILAKKALAITFISTGDNFKAIKILQELPPDDDINLNLAKAYNYIERPDVALPLLKNNSQPEARELKNQITTLIKPAIRPIYGLYHESGDANAVKYQKIGGEVDFYPRANIKTIGSILATKYSSVQNVTSGTGTLYSIGANARPVDKLSLTGSVGIEDFSYNGQIVLGNSLFKLIPNDYLSWNVGYLRTLDEVDSFMSAAGVVPSVGPFANQLVGRIVDNKFVVSNLSLKLPYSIYAYGGYNLGYKRGSNSPSNPYQEVPFGVGKVIFSAPKEFFLNQVQTGYDFFYTAYKYDRSGFGGANLNYSPVGSDGMNPNPSAGNPGVGGYFSPLSFFSNRFSLNMKGNLSNNKVKYLLNGFIGNQSIKGAYGLTGSGLGRTNSLYYGMLANLSINEAGRIGLDANYQLSNYRTVLQQLFMVNLIFRF